MVREIWPCSRGHVTAQMTDLPYPVIYLISPVSGAQLIPRLQYFVNSTSLMSMSVIRHYSRVNFRGQGQLRSIIVLLWPEVKFSTWPSEEKIHVPMRFGERETRLCLNEFDIFLGSKVIREKTVHPKIFFTLTQPGPNPTKCRECASAAFGNIHEYYEDSKYIFKPFSIFSAMLRLYERNCVQYISYLLPVCGILAPASAAKSYLRHW